MRISSDGAHNLHLVDAGHLLCYERRGHRVPGSGGYQEEEKPDDVVDLLFLDLGLQWSTGFVGQ